MVKIYDAKALEFLAKSGKLLAEVKAVIYQSMQVGVSTLWLNDLAEHEILSRHALPAFKGYNGFPFTICISINEELIHGMPSSRLLKVGDLVKVDVGLIYEGYYSDSAFTKIIGQSTPLDEKLISVAKGAFLAGIKAIKPGARLGDVEYAIGEFVKQAGFFVASNYCGHGIGKSLHEDPNVHNSGKPNCGIELKPGMVLAIEPMILQTSGQTFVANDGWTVIAKDKLKTSHYEHTIVLLEDLKVKILTEGI